MNPHRCTGPDPCTWCETQAEQAADEYVEWTQRDLDVMADYAAAREYGGGR